MGILSSLHFVSLGYHYFNKKELHYSTFPINPERKPRKIAIERSERAAGVGMEGIINEDIPGSNRFLRREKADRLGRV